MHLSIANTDLYEANQSLVLIFVNNQKYLMHNDDAMCKYLQQFQTHIISIPNILPRVTRHGVWIGNWIYWTLITRNYSSFQPSCHNIYKEWRTETAKTRNSLDTKKKCGWKKFRAVINMMYYQNM
jgi:hypothetical protein